MKASCTRSFASSASPTIARAILNDPRQSLQQFIANAPMTIQARPGDANLPRIEKDSLGHAGYRQFEIGVRQHDHRGLATEFQ